MFRPTMALVPILATLAIGAASARSLADAPKIADISPAGVRRGTAETVTIRGEDLVGNPRLVASFEAEVAPATGDEPSGDDAWRFTLTVPADLPVGTYPVRVRTDEGLSNPMLLAVGQVPQVAEREPNNAPDQAHEVTTPCVVDGRAEGNDVDFIRFAARKGDRIVVDAQACRVGSGLDPTVRLTTASGRYVASDDDSPGLLTDARLVVELPEDGDYLVELSDSQYQGASRPSYRLMIGPVPVADEVFPLGGRRGETVGLELRGGTLPGLVVAAATLDAPEDTPTALPRIPGALLGPGVEFDVEPPHSLALGSLPELREPADPAAPPIRVAPPATINGRLELEGDEDRFVVLVQAGKKYRATVEAMPLGSAMDGVLRVLGPDGDQLEQGDDTEVALSKKGGEDAETMNSPDPSVEFDVPDGVAEVTLALRDLSSRGGIGFPYRLTVSPSTPGFEVELMASQVNVPRGGAAHVPVNVVRQGFDGPVTLTADGLPDGLTAREGRVPAGQSGGVLTLLAGPEADVTVESLTVLGTGEGPGGPIVASAETSVIFATIGGFPANVRRQHGLAVATALPSPIALETPTGPIEVVRGFGAEVPITLTRIEGAVAALEVEPLPTPEGLSVAKATIAEGETTGTVTLAASVEAPLGRTTVAFNAKGKFGDDDRIFAVPAVAVEVVHPAMLSLASPGVEVKAGESVEVKGTLARRGPFAGEVTIALQDLPNGLTAEPVTLGGDASEFTLTLAAAPDAPAGKADAKATAAFSIGEKEYPSPSATIAVTVVAKEGP